MGTKGKGIFCAGTIVIDFVVVVDQWPTESSLSNILYQKKTGGGGPFNVAKDLRAMDENLPLSLIGLLGNDENGRWLIEDCRASNIDTKLISISQDQTPTSYTYVISVESTGKRTLFNQRGTNALFDESHFDFEYFLSRLDDYKLFYLSYLTILDKLDEIVDGKCGAERVLKRAKEIGLETIVDFVSVGNKFYSEIGRLTLPHVDHLILNEIEFGFLVHRSFENETIEQIEEAGQILLEQFGVRQSATIHFETGAVCFHRKDSKTINIFRQGSFVLPSGFIKGSVGAGDAFASGIIYGISKNYSIEERLVCGICVATMSLTDETPFAGVRTIDQCFQLRNRFSFRSLENSTKLTID